MRIPDDVQCYVCGAPNRHGTHAPDGYFVCLQHRQGVGAILLEERDQAKRESDRVRQIADQKDHVCAYRLQVQSSAEELEQAKATIEELRGQLGRAAVRLAQRFGIPQPDPGTDLAEFVEKAWRSHPRVADVLATSRRLTERAQQDTETLKSLRASLAVVEAQRTKAAKAEANATALVRVEKERAKALEDQLAELQAELAEWRAAFRR